MFLDYYTWGLYTLTTFFTVYIIISKQELVKKHIKEVFVFFIALGIYSLYIRYFDRIFTLNYSYDFGDFPKGYCRVSFILSVIFLFTKNKKLAGFLFFQTGLGFFSVLFPGGDFFVLTQDHHNFGYIFDHFLLALMPFIIVLILDITPSRRAFIISLVYSIVVPIAYLPYALETGTNAYYILDGVFIKMVFGNNQVVITIVYVIGITLYHLLMYYLLTVLKNLRNQKEHKLLKPITPFILFISYFVIGLLIATFIVRGIPDTVINHTDSYLDQPIKELDEFGYVYGGTKDGKTIYFIEIVKKYEEVVIMDTNGNYIDVLNEGDIYYYYEEDVTTTKVIFMLYKNMGEENEKLRTYNMNN